MFVPAIKSRKADHFDRSLYYLHMFTEHFMCFKDEPKEDGPDPYNYFAVHRFDKGCNQFFVMPVPKFLKTPPVSPVALLLACGSLGDDKVKKFAFETWKNHQKCEIAVSGKKGKMKIVPKENPKNLRSFVRH